MTSGAGRVPWDGSRMSRVRIACSCFAEGTRVTPTQLRAFAAVVRLGSVKRAAADLAVSEAAVSLHVGQLRKELGDKLFVRTSSGLAFTPGGLRLASRAAEMLSLQDRTILEVRQAGGGRRLLRVATSALFAEHAAPGLIELFADRANDLDVELSSHSPGRFESLLLTRTVDAAIGPRPANLDASIASTHFLNYQVVAVAGPDHPMTKHPAGRQRAAGTDVAARPVGGRRHRGDSEHAATDQRARGPSAHLPEPRRGARGSQARQGVGAGPVVRRLAGPRQRRPEAGHRPRRCRRRAAWSILTLSEHHAPPAAAELTRFVTTPRATQAMLRGTGVTLGRFKPSIHVTLWS